jgi:hypothetical protein
MNKFNFSNIDRELFLIDLATSVDDDENDVYQKKIVEIPEWYHVTVTSLLSFLGIFGVMLNGFVIWCFSLCPTVNNLLF